MKRSFYSESSAEADNRHFFKGLQEVFLDLNSAGDLA
jgi:hypothetical protein